MTCYLSATYLPPICHPSATYPPTSPCRPICVHLRLRPLPTTLGAGPPQGGGAGRFNKPRSGSRTGCRTAEVVAAVPASGAAPLIGWPAVAGSQQVLDLFHEIGSGEERDSIASAQVGVAAGNEQLPLAGD